MICIEEYKHTSFWLVWSYDSQTLCSHMEICEDLRLSKVRIHCSKSWLSMCWLILANLDEELLKQEDKCDIAKDTEHIVTWFCFVKQ